MNIEPPSWIVSDEEKEAWSNKDIRLCCKLLFKYSSVSFRKGEDIKARIYAQKEQEYISNSYAAKREQLEIDLLCQLYKKKDLSEYARSYILKQIQETRDQWQVKYGVYRQKEWLALKTFEVKRFCKKYRRYFNTVL